MFASGHQSRQPSEPADPPCHTLSFDTTSGNGNDDHEYGPVYEDMEQPGRRGRSRFTYRNLADLASSVPSCPLRVIAHIDLDAYYAQCEMLRLGIGEDTPLVVQQWRNIIAVNYPARAFGIGRMVSIDEAKRQCPHLVVQHVPTWKEGESQWAYHADAYKNMARHKVSLEPYRIRSREILATIKEAVPVSGGPSGPSGNKSPGSKCRIEKAGIDEVFVDLSAHVHDVLVDRLYGSELLADYREHYQDTPNEFLPLPPVRSAADLDWAATGSGVIDAGTGQDHQPTEEKTASAGGEQAPSQEIFYSSQEDLQRSQGTINKNADDNDDVVDWDDIAMLEGARVVQSIRQALYDKLRFRCSAGIASNKMLSKLGSSQHKPNKQTVVRPQAAAPFLASLSSVKKLRGLGGKMGSRVVDAFDTTSISELLAVPLAQLQAKVGDEEAGCHIYGMIRGIDHSEVTARTEIKSIISAKSFNPPLLQIDQAKHWLRVYAAELKCRLLDERLSMALLAAATVAPGGEALSVDGQSTSKEHPSLLESAVPEEQLPSSDSGTNGSAGILSHSPSFPHPAPGFSDPSAKNKQKHGYDHDTSHDKTKANSPRKSGDDDTPHTNPLHQQQALHEQHALRLPQTIRLHYGSGGGSGWRSRQTRIPRDGQPLDEEKLLRLGTHLLQQAQQNDGLFPCAHLAISVDGFEDPPAKGNRSIQAFFQPTAASSSGVGENKGVDGRSGERYLRDEETGDLPSTKRRRIATTPTASTRMMLWNNGDHNKQPREGSEQPDDTSSSISSHNKGTTASSSGSSHACTFQCDQCSCSFSNAVQLQEHQDWHVARALQARERIVLAPASSAGGGAPGNASRHRGTLAKRSSTPISSFFFNKSDSPTKTAEPKAAPAAPYNRGVDNDDTRGGKSGAAAGKPLVCSRCATEFGDADDLQIHEDWHFAKDLERG